VASRRSTLIALNALGGAAVLASYYAGARSLPAEALWGGVPERARSLYTVCMFLAAGGYFLFTPYIALRLDPNATRIAGRFDYHLFHLLYALVLVPSALWLPLTGVVIEAPSALHWALVRADLALVALGSLGLLASLLALPRSAPRGRGLAVLGIVPFCVQTALLDAVIWPALFPIAVH
jgi:hypothetical protein